MYEDAKLGATKDEVENTFYVGIESGYVQHHGYWYEETWCVICYQGQIYDGRSITIKLPDIMQVGYHAGNKIEDILSKIRVKLGMDPKDKDTWKVHTNLKLSRGLSIESGVQAALISLLSGDGSYGLVPKHLDYAW